MFAATRGVDHERARVQRPCASDGHDTAAGHDQTHLATAERGRSAQSAGRVAHLEETVAGTTSVGDITVLVIL